MPGTFAMFFSVLMSVYYKENAHFFRESLRSLVPQVNFFREVVIVEDGPIGQALQGVIDEFTDKLPIRLVLLEKNGGLANALNKGIDACSSEWIFRFDTDDVCVPERAQIQWEAIIHNSVDILGGQIEECDPETLEAACVRRVPCDVENIFRFSKSRNPFNHVTVCFKKSLVKSLGGYPVIYMREDYGLWAKAIAAGARVQNLPDVIVRVRAGRDMVKRRGGLRYMRAEIDLQQFLFEQGVKSSYEAVRDGVARAGIFLLPTPLRHRFFMRYLRNAF
jgi:glycosyltransferase involved in cell wall biosynthesis